VYLFGFFDFCSQDHVTDIPTGNPTLEDLGVSLTDMESRMDWELKPYRAQAYYDEELGEFAPPAPPKTVSVGKYGEGENELMKSQRT